MKVLLHICCAVCLAGPLDALRAEGHEVVGFFHNPNIHPLIEFRRRLKAVKIFAERRPLTMICDEKYGLYDYLGRIYAAGPADAERMAPPRRCAGCYRMRMERTATEARDRGFEAFTTTLLVSRHQYHDRVRRIGEAAAEKAGVSFLYRDFRPLCDQSHEIARGQHLYLQSYCGCIFSEEERYRDTTRHLYRGPGNASDAQTTESSE